MTTPALSLRDLEYLVAVDELRHFRKAAEACHVSQPALSSQVRKTEELLNVTLFERDKRSVTTTAAGEAIVAQARLILEEAARLLEIAGSHAEPLSGPLRIGAIASLGPYLIPHLIGPIRKEFPKLELLLREGLTDGLLADLKRGTIDVVLASRTFSDETLRIIPLFFEPFVLAAPARHLLAKKSPLLSTDLREEEMVLLEDGHCLSDEALSLCQKSHRGRRRKFHATSLETLRHLVASGLGYTIIPKLAVRDDRGLHRLIRYRPFESGNTGRHIVLATRKNFTKKGDIDVLAAFIRSIVPRCVEPARTPFGA